MSRKIFITIGVLLLTLLLVLWAYLLIQPPSEGPIETWFGGSLNPTPITETFEEHTVSQLALPNTVLAQLTTRSVAGYGQILDGPKNSSSTKARAIRYAETGTGHVYEIDLVNSTETRISAVTLAKTVGASFDHTGKAYILTTERNNSTESRLYIAGEGSREYYTLPANSSNFYFTVEDNLRYTVVEEEQTKAYQLNWTEGSTTLLWSIPLTQVRVYWTKDNAIVVNRVSSMLKGGVYEITSGTLKQLVSPRPSLSAVVDPESMRIWYSYYDSNQQGIIGFTYDMTTNTTTSVNLPAVPEKCYLRNGSDPICAISATLISGSRADLNRWYRGEVSSSDQLWEQRGEVAVYLQNLAEIAGFSLDVDSISPTMEPDGFLFINKSNRTLWRYRFDQ